MNPCIVYLAQNSERDTQYGRDSRSMLERSLDLLYQHYNDRFGHPVLIFHEGDFKAADQQDVAKGRSEIRFEEIQFEVPDFLPLEEVPETWRGFHPYGMGHRHMIRFYSIQLFDLLRDLGFDYYFRMDDDSFIHSTIDYDLFEFMERDGYDYGYRVDVQDGVDVCRGFGETVHAYLVSEGIEPHFFYEHLKRQSMLGAAARRGLNGFKNLVKRALMGVDAERRYGLWHYAPVPASRDRLRYDRWGYYNNFHITRVAFWHQPEVQSFLRHMDRIGGGYKYRWNDLILQSTAVQIFLPKRKVYKFRDWTYEHATIKGEKLFFGGIYPGRDDTERAAVREFRARYGKTRTPQTH